MVLTSSSGTDGPRLHVVGIRPHEVTERSLVGNFLGARHHPHLVQSTDLRTESTMYTQYLAINDSAQRHEVEDLAAGLPHRGTTIFLETFLVEPINLRNLTGLVVTAYQSDSIGVSSTSDVSAERRQFSEGGWQHSLGLETQQQSQRLQTEISTIHVVSQKHKIAI